MVKLVNSVVLDHVTIEDGATVHNCIVTSNSCVKANTTLKDVTLASNGSSEAVPQ